MSPAIARLTRTAEALAAYDAEDAPRLAAMIDGADTNEQVQQWQREQETAARRVQDAFFEDCVATGIPNSREHCRLVPLSQLREWSGA